MSTLSAREQACAAFFGLFAGVSYFNLKERSWTNEIDELAELPALIQTEAGETPEYLYAGLVQNTVDITITVFVSVAPGPLDRTLGAEVNKAIAVARAAVAAYIRHPQLNGGIFARVEYRGFSEIELSDANGPLGGAALLYAVTYVESDVSPYAL